jgi:DNA-binding transcriptional ArsR family regulator
MGFFEGMCNAPYNSGLAFFRTTEPILNQDIFELLGKQELIEQAAHAMRSISHPLRLKILCLVADAEMSVQDIVDAVGTSQSNVSQHLAILRDKGVLTARKHSNRVYYRIVDARTMELIGMMRKVFCGMPEKR